MAKDEATRQWSDGQGYWDFNRGAPNAAYEQSKQLQANQFATMIWKGTNLVDNRDVGQLVYPEGVTHDVGFGLHCGTVLAWYCPNKPKTPNLRENLDNVCRSDGTCADSDYICTKDGYDKCYNQMALDAHNAKRALHCANQKMTLDVEMAKALQKMLNLKQAPTVKADRPEAYRDCYENFFQDSSYSEAAVRETNRATDTWYAGKDNYDFDTGLGKPASVGKAEYEPFTAIVWKGQTANDRYKVAFARRFNAVIAWYCPVTTGGAGVNTVGFRTNVLHESCPKECEDDLPGDKFYKCYQTDAAAAHNVKRREHLVPDLTVDYDLAKKAQGYAERYAAAAVPEPPQKTKNCYLNHWKAPLLAGAKDAQQATDHWYEKNREYDFAKKIMQPAARAFTAMIWRSSTKVGFGRAGNHVVALYCDTRGNDEGRFACNVCEKGVGCDTASCPMPQTVCSTSDGQGNAEISLAADRASMRIIATVKRGQVFSLALGSESLVDTDLIVFTAATTAADSTVVDSRATQNGVRPSAQAQSAIQAPTTTEIKGGFIRFDITRRLSPGLADHYDFVKGRTHSLGWGQYRSGDFTAIADQGTCALSLSDVPTDPTSKCPASKRDSTTDPSRQEDCSPALDTPCYDSSGQYANSKCPSGNSCARWVVTRPNGGGFYLDGCLLTQYCGTTGNYRGKPVKFDCPNQGPKPEPAAGRQGTRCTEQQENDASNKKRAPTCSSFRACANRATNEPEDSSCEANERCAKYAWKGSSGAVYAYQHACVLRKYCGLQDASLSGWDFDGARYDYTTALQCAGGSEPQEPVRPSCTGGQVYTAGRCQCPSGQRLVNGQCQVVPTCLPAQFPVNGVCTCPPGLQITTTGLGCETALTCLSAQTPVGGQCTCPAGQELIPYAPGCQARRPRCLTN